MGNKLCKKKSDASSPPPQPPPPPEKSPSAFDRIISKFSTRKQKCKSDTNLDEKQVNSYQVTPTKDETDNTTSGLSKSTEWTDVPLIVPDRRIDNTSTPKNNNNEDGDTPVPPPRKKKSLRETLGSLIQYKKPIEEQVMVQRKIDYRCPCCEDGMHRSPRVEKKERELAGRLNGKESSSLKEVKKRKTPSIASLPNYGDFKLTIAGETGADALDLEKHSSVHSLPDEAKKNGQLKGAGGGDKIDNVLTRARSFGSLLPTMFLHKMSTAKAPLAEIESDDSLGGLDDWGLNMIEHYKPRDSSLPRPRRPKTQEELLAEIENQIVIVEDDTEETIANPPIAMNNVVVKKMVTNATPEPPVRNAKEPQIAQPVPAARHQLNNAQNKQSNSPAAVEATKPEVPARTRDLQSQSAFENVANKKNTQLNETYDNETNTINGNYHYDYDTSNQTTIYNIPLEEEPEYRNGAEHSSLMRILQKYSGEDANANTAAAGGMPPLPNARDKHPINDFLNAERGVKNTITT